MSQELVEHSKYSLPTAYRFNPRILLDLDNASSFEDIALLALGLGFKAAPELPINGGSTWTIYERNNAVVPNFPIGGTLVSSRLGLYDEGSETKHAVLRTSLDPIQKKDFEKDLNTLTQHFIKRPKMFGFPSRLLSNPVTYVGATLVGMLAGGTVSYINGESVVNLPMIIGQAGGPTAILMLYGLSEKMVRNKVLHDSELAFDSDATNFLYDERAHRTTVRIQTEIYNVLRSNGDISPEDFLRIFEEFPESLVEARMAQIEEWEILDPSEKTSRPYEALVSIGRVLQAV